MPAGIKILNNESRIIIDETFFNYSFVGKYTGAFQANTGPVSGGFGHAVTVDLPGTERPIVAVSYAKPWTFVSLLPITGGWRVKIMAEHGGTTALGEIATFYVFDRPKEIAGAGYGLRVYDAAGKQVFDARQKYMRVVDARTLFVGDMPFTLTVASGAYAQIMTYPYYMWTGTTVSPTAPWVWLMQASFVTSRATGYDLAVLHGGEGTYPKLGNPPPVAANSRVQIITVDVSGY